MRDLSGKRALVVGLGKSGKSACRFLSEKGVRVVLNDQKDKLDLTELDGCYEKAMLGMAPSDCFDGIDLIVISPGVDFNQPWVKEAEKQGIELVSEIELAYWFCPCEIVAITGTNGKTTTTTLVGEIFKASGRRTHVLGNIGVPMTSQVDGMRPEDVVVCELSSFQILNCKAFAPKVFAFLNLTPDHLDKYHTMERYAESKAMMLDMMHCDSISVLNRGDRLVSRYHERVKGELLWFANGERVEDGAFCLDGKLVFHRKGTETVIMDKRALRILGEHNVENALAAIAMTMPLGVPADVVKRALSQFSGVEHRLEIVDTVDGVTYINDSKGTNVDASIVAIAAMDKPTVLIAGGYDKHTDFTPFIEAFGDKIVDVVVTGDTAEQIKEAAYRLGYTHIHGSKDFCDAVRIAAGLAGEGQNVLLSPACASWDHFTNYEERGKVFKDIVKELKQK